MELTLTLFFTVLTESSSGYVRFQAQSTGQDHELDVDNSSEELVRTGSPSPALQNTDTPPSASSPVNQPTSISSQDARSGMAKSSQPPPNGVQQCLERALAAATAGSSQQCRVTPNLGLDPVPPALPPKTRKAKVLEAPKVLEHSDRGDSDMDEETYSSSQEKLKVKKVCCMLVIPFVCHCVYTLHPREIQGKMNLTFSPNGANLLYF